MPERNKDQDISNELMNKFSNLSREAATPSPGAGEGQRKAEDGKTAMQQLINNLEERYNYLKGFKSSELNDMLDEVDSCIQQATKLLELEKQQIADAYQQSKVLPESITAEMYYTQTYPR